MCRKQPKLNNLNYPPLTTHTGRLRWGIPRSYLENFNREGLINEKMD